MEKLCSKGFLAGVSEQNRKDFDIQNYVNSLMRKSFENQGNGLKRNKRQIRRNTATRVSVSPDKYRYEVRHPNIDMVWGRFANRTRRLANFSVSLHSV